MENNIADNLLILDISDEVDISNVRQNAMKIAKEIGFEKIKVYYIGTSVSELASNVFFHTIDGGKICIKKISKGEALGIEISSEDNGPGIKNISAAMEDGYSTNGGLGGGLPGMKRMMDEFYIESEYGKGTRVTIRMWK